MNDIARSTANTGLLKAEQRKLLRRVEGWLEVPMQVLSFAWLALLIVELTRGISPALETASISIWTVLILDFLLRLVIAPNKSSYLKSNWFTAISLLVPALRLVRVLRALRVLRLSRIPRGLRVLRIVGSLNRGMRALGLAMRRRGFAYVLGLTAIVLFVGAAGMYRFESESQVRHGFGSYGEALWWTSMIMTTMGSDIFPQTSEGRALCLLLSVYAFAVFGYVTASVAAFFVDRDKESATEVKRLRVDIAALREEVRILNGRREGGVRS